MHQLWASTQLQSGVPASQGVSATQVHANLVPGSSSAGYYASASGVAPKQITSSVPIPISNTTLGSGLAAEHGFFVTGSPGRRSL